ncbi:transglycosylase SLT domain-containing protein, partial [Streptomyces albidoflavus]|uniref:aggregation-promoting factor C-terminal-like domain-containing protein n=1 Tax=Streptomyces albidoflavus TaxID=1886 RepID=UPI00211CF2C5
ALAASAAGLAFTAAPAQAAEGSPQAIAQQMIGDDAQYQAFSNIVERESGWDPHATNESSGAYGLVQALPANKMASDRCIWECNPPATRSPPAHITELRERDFSPLSENP